MDRRPPAGTQERRLEAGGTAAWKAALQSHRVRLEPDPVAFPTLARLVLQPRQSAGSTATSWQI